jgi:hypothetical protein
VIPSLAGIVGAALLIGLARMLPVTRRALLFALLLAAATAVYTGADLAGAGPSTVGLVFLAGFILTAFIGERRPAVLAAGWLGHALWDAAHYSGALATPLPGGYLLACFAADLVWGAYLFTLRS